MDPGKVILEVQSPRQAPDYPACGWLTLQGGERQGAARSLWQSGAQGNNSSLSLRGPKMDRDRALHGAQKAKLDQFTTSGLTGGASSKAGGGLHAPQGPTGAQILSAIEAFSANIQAKIDSVPSM
ncbi:hypothetical protein NDU88_004772 [Pleurodeles waltl]|uniref:Uncharacterized protein n=1 Tax=Pleurodeles waltl TaxID=8319 RepID=A0AAV7LVN5_PLEWA|nr:hypothetical protein NDU88_004772 [Pleurodeles waltl]